MPARARAAATQSSRSGPLPMIENATSVPASAADRIASTSTAIPFWGSIRPAKSIRTGPCLASQDATACSSPRIHSSLSQVAGVT